MPVISREAQDKVVNQKKQQAEDLAAALVAAPDLFRKAFPSLIDALVSEARRCYEFHSGLIGAVGSAQFLAPHAKTLLKNAQLLEEFRQAFAESAEEQPENFELTFGCAYSKYDNAREDAIRIHLKILNLEQGS